MNMSPLQPLIAGYALAAVMAVAGALSGLDAVTTLLVFWIGGAPATLAIAAFAHGVVRGRGARDCADLLVGHGKESDIYGCSAKDRNGKDSSFANWDDDLRAEHIAGRIAGRRRRA